LEEKKAMRYCNKHARLPIDCPHCYGIEGSQPSPAPELPARALLQKPGPELDALIAEKVMGWRWIQPPKHDYDGPLPEQGLVLAPPEFTGDGFAWPNRGVVHAHYFLNGGDRHRYSTDIAAAWEVLAKLAFEGWGIELEYHQCHEPWWEAALNHMDLDAIDGVRSSVSASHAICLAALKAVSAA
jgi:hypothetical protein